MKDSKIKTQLSLAFIAFLAPILLLVPIWYHIRLSDSLKYLENYNMIMTSLIVLPLLLYIVSILKKVSLFLPGIVTILMYSTVLIRVLLDLSVYPAVPMLYHFHLPLESLFIVMFSIDSKEKHIRRSIRALKK
jgi:hypothetical protein